jgi:N-acetylglucosamine-6-phosphate deacetylase
MNKKKIVNANIITDNQIIYNGCLLIKNGIIEAVLEKDVQTEDYQIIDAENNYVSPGFIDIHTHGGGGYDFMDGTVEAYLNAAKIHAKHGTTSMLPTTIASNICELKDTFDVYKIAKEKSINGASFLGIHLEGPYFSFAQKGAQDSRYLKNPEPKEYEKILSWTDDIVRWSAAPELDGALEFAKTLKPKGILPSIAHTDATYEQVETAFECGFTHITHLYSCMSTVHRINAYRYAGVVESAYLIDDMTVEIIVDGVHLPSSLLKLVYKLKGADKIALVTDSMRAAGMPEGESILGSLKDGQRVIIEDGVAKLPDRTAFAGSVATTDRLVRNMINLADVPLIEAVKMMTQTPAKIIGVNKTKGSIEVGKDADIVLFDDNIDIKMTIVGGRIIFSSNKVEI